MENSVNYFLKSKKLIEFAKDIAKNGLKQAYLFSSNDKFKNFAFCKILGLVLSCKNQNMCLSCSSCQKILDDNCLDFIVYPKEKSIVVEDVKEIIESSYVLPLENEYKIYVLNNFEEANDASQNKFLKTLEEPPKNVIFLLNTTNSDMILNTIKSRCEKIVLPKFDEDEFKELLRQNNLDFISSVFENCDNELGNYILLLESNFCEDFDFCFEMLKNMKTSSDILKYSSKILKMKNHENFFKALLSILTDCEITKIDENRIKNKSRKEDINLLSQDFSQKAIDEIIKNLIKANKELKFNTSLNLVVDCLLIDILEEKHKWN